MPNPDIFFSVDTHVFRELGELLVGRDSTALLELIKNCYDADATHVVVTALNLSDVARGTVVIRDNGSGMDEERFKHGFLRIASRLKEEGERRSTTYKRRYTGSKGIGRLAAHKLAKFMQVASLSGVPGKQVKKAINATIDWERIEYKPTLDKLTDEITLKAETLSRAAPVGTTITLTQLRRPWSDRERTRFISECRSFQVPDALRDPLPTRYFGPKLLFTSPQLRDAANDDPGCKIELEGDFDEGDSYWDPLLALCGWAVEIDCLTDKKSVKYVIAPSKSTIKDSSDAKRRAFEHEHPSPETGPFFQARILIRDDKIQDKTVRDWSRENSGVRVYLEGFRVLPYGDKGDDWLGLDAATARRSWERDTLTAELLAEEPDDAGDWELYVLPNNSYTGAVFLTQEGAPSLRMLVNREGFVAERDYDILVEIVKRGLDLSIRTRAAATFRTKRNAPKPKANPVDPTPQTSSADEVPRPSELDKAKTTLLGSIETMQKKLSGTKDPIQIEIADTLKLTHSVAVEVIRGTDRQADSAAMGRVLSSLGTQMASFVHEINGMLGTAVAVHESLGRLREDRSITGEARTRLNGAHKDAGDLRRQIERQAAYMVEITSTDARRRRSRQPLADRFEAATRIVSPAIERRSIRLSNEIPKTLKSAPMFPSELTVVYTNILRNAVKAAGADGEIRSRGTAADGKTTIVLENTGNAVDLKDAERWFLPFESTTAEVDSTLGQGMGLGLTITRDILQQYGAGIRFIQPASGYATAIEIQFLDQEEKP